MVSLLPRGQLKPGLNPTGSQRQREAEEGLCLFLIDDLTNDRKLDGLKEYVFYT